jgi:peptidoglycan glycosyltransferase
MSDDGLGGGIGSGLARFGALLAAGAILAFGLLQRQGNTDARWLLALAASAPFFVILFWPRLPRDLPTFNRTVVRIGTLLVVAFLLTSIHLVRLQVVRADDLAHETHVTTGGDTVANQRILLEQLRSQRGRIVDRNGKLLADTETTPEGYALRRYPSAVGSYVTGYYSPQLYGLAGLESAYDPYLRGSAGSNPLVTLQRDLLHEPLVGNDLVLTLDLNLQQVADAALAGRPGAVVALDPRTGAILANVSAPRFDPQQLVIDPRDEQQEIARAKAYWAALNAEGEHDPLLPRGSQGLYVPGSIFKTVTVSAGLDSGVISTNKIYPDPGDIVIDGHQIVELNRPQPVKDQYSVTEGYLYSLNIVFAQIALDIGTVRMNEYTRRFGFGQEIPFNGLPGATGPTGAASSISSDPNYLSNKPALADTGFGQGEILVSPLHMALITAAMANGGKMPEPYLVGAVRDPEGHVLQQTSPKTWLTPISANTADQVRKLMIASVESGGSQGAKTSGLVVGGKTGTAELGDGTSHAWFICFAGKPNQPPEIAVAVIVERAGPGSTNALPIAKQVIEAYFAGKR